MKITENLERLGMTLEALKGYRDMASKEHVPLLDAIIKNLDMAIKELKLTKSKRKRATRNAYLKLKAKCIKDLTEGKNSPPRTVHEARILREVKGVVAMKLKKNNKKKLTK